MFAPIFSPFFCKYTLTDVHQNEVLKRYSSYIEKQSETPEQPPGWACEVETSFEYSDESKIDNFASTHPNKDELKVNEVFQHYIFDCLKQLDWPIGPYYFGSWYNAYGKNHYQEPHSHLTHQLSGVYFLSYDPEIHGSFMFINPFEDLIQLAYPKVVNRYHPISIFRSEEEPLVKSGDLIIFPSWMRHRVQRPVPQDKPKMDMFTDETYPKRVTISFNIDMYDWYEHYPSIRNNIALQ